MSNALSNTAFRDGLLPCLLGCTDVGASQQGGMPMGWKICCDDRVSAVSKRPCNGKHGFLAGHSTVCHDNRWSISLKGVAEGMNGQSMYTGEYLLYAHAQQQKERDGCQKVAVEMSANG